MARGGAGGGWRLALRAAAGLAVLAGGVAVAQVIAEPLSVQGALCVGSDCVNGEGFADDVYRMKENNTRLAFRDTSDPAAAPAADWRFTANDSRNGGPDLFSLDDLGGPSRPFLAGAPIGADADATLAVALGDFDGNGTYDLVAASDGTPNRVYLAGATLNPFETATGYDLTADAQATTSVAVADLDGDFRVDVVVGNDGQPNRFYSNDGGSPPFLLSVGADVGADSHATAAVVLADVAGNARPDVLVANVGEPNFVYVNDGTATPFAGAVGVAITGDIHLTTSLAVADVNQDGLPDVVAGNYGQPNRLYLHNGTADPYTSGQDATSDAHATTAIALGDVNGDGFADLVVGNDGQADRVYLGDGSDVPFASGADLGTDAEATTAILLADVNGDSLPDVVAGADGAPVRFYQSAGGADPFQGVVGRALPGDPGATTSLALVGVGPFGTLQTPNLVAGVRGAANLVHLPLDRSGGSSPVIVEAGAPDDALHVDAGGRVGVGTATPDPDAAVHVAGSVRIEGDLLLRAGARSGVVLAGDFGGARETRVTFAAPQSRDYVVILTPLAARPGARLRPAVTARDADGFTLTRGGKAKDLVAIHWSTRWLGEY